MFATPKPRTWIGQFFSLLSLVFHSTVRSIRSSHSSPVIGLIINILQAMVMVAMFYVMGVVLGLRSAGLRGDLLLFVISGVFLFMTHIKTVGAVAGAAGPTSSMMLHARMNTLVSIMAAALSSLYIQTLSLFIILFVYHVVVTPLAIQEPVAAFGLYLLAWASGAAVGMVFLALAPWFPNFVSVAKLIYQRANMIASGKMFVANTLPPSMVVMFDWNPLFHAIDQCRGHVFINYTPHVTSLMYPIYFTIVFCMLGLMGEFYTRKHASLSWGAGR